MLTKPTTGLALASPRKIVKRYRKEAKMIRDKDQRGAMTIFRALAHRNYRLFFSGQSISLVGTWMQQIATSWLIFDLTHSAFLLGIVTFASRIPTFLLASFAGVLVDRWNRHRILVVTQILSMIQALVLAFLVLSDRIEVWQIIGLSLILGLINALDIPARQSFVVDMVETKEDLGNAIALNSSMVNGARLIGPSIAGLLIATLGEGVCFLLNGLSFIPVIASLLAMEIRPDVKTRRTPRFYKDSKKGCATPLVFRRSGQCFCS
jgi:MFS family permease